MDDAAETCAKIERLAIEMAKSICDASVSVEGASRMRAAAARMLEYETALRIHSLAFQERVAGLKRQEARLRLAKNEKQIRAQLGAFGIDPEPIFEDQAPGGA